MIIALLLAAAATDDLRDLCTDRPGKLTPGCIVDAGHLLVEVGAIDFTHAVGASGTIDTTLAGDTMLRYGVTDHLEVVGEWVPYGHQRTRAGGGGAATVDGVGDVTLGVKQSLFNPDGDGLSVAVQPFVTIPTAPAAIGVGSPLVGVLLATTLNLPAQFQLALTPQIIRAADTGAQGHHARYTLGGGVSRMFGRIEGGVELVGTHDDDPLRRTTQATADVVLTYIPKAQPNLQFDTAAIVGLNHDTPDVEIRFGVSQRF